MARRFTEILDTVHAAITIKDLEGRFTLVNPRAVRLIGGDREQLLGRTAGEVLGGPDGDRIGELDRRVLATGGHEVAEEVHHIGGKEHVLISERFPLHDLDGRPVAVCCVSREVTRERELQRELLQTERLAAVGKLAAGVAHELNNPLTGILTFAEDLLYETDPADPRWNDYQTIVGEALRCRRIVRDLLDFSRRRAPRLQPLDLGPVIRQTVAMVARQASFHDVAIEVDHAPRLPRVAIDFQQIQQAILNLLINARDAMDGRGRVAIRTASTAEGEVSVTVADTGPGVPEELRQRIFEPFFTTKGDQGNGLGLPAVASVMEQHRGRVEVDRGAEGGAVFRLCFPPADEPEEQR
jgi:two-component system NtrC family sensor kinase